MEIHQEFRNQEYTPPIPVNSDRTDDMVSIEKTSATETSLNDLDEYCLLDITKQLSVMDLCTLAETCKYFKRLAQSVFPKKFVIVISTDFFLQGCDLFVCGTRQRLNCKQDVERILKNFGSRFDALSLFGNRTDVSSVARYCNNGDVTLRRLEIRRMDSIEDLSVQLTSILRRLLTLSVKNCHFSDQFVKMNCDALTEIEIIDSSNCSAILSNHFPNLERFRIRCYLYERGLNTFNILSQFVGRHKRLRILYLNGRFQCSIRELVQTIGNCNNDLEELTLRNDSTIQFNDFRIDLSMLSLPKLKKLNLLITDENYETAVALLQASSSLEIVTIYFWDEIRPHYFDCLLQQQGLRELNLYFYPLESILFTKLTQLKVLRLYDQLDVDNFRATDLVNIIKRLTNLDVFLFDSSSVGLFTLGNREVEEIVHIAKRRATEITLKCKFDFDLMINWDEVPNLKLEQT